MGLTNISLIRLYGFNRHSGGIGNRQATDSFSPGVGNTLGYVHLSPKPIMSKTLGHLSSLTKKIAKIVSDLN